MILTDEEKVLMYHALTAHIIYWKERTIEYYDGQKQGMLDKSTALLEKVEQDLTTNEDGSKKCF